MEILQNCVTPLRNFKFENQDPQKLLLYTHGYSTFFLIDPLNFHMFSVQYPWKFHVVKPHLSLGFSWNNPFWGVLAKKPTQKQPKKTVSAGTKMKNWRTAAPISTKRAWYVYHLNTLHLLKTVGVNQRAAEGISKRLGIKKYHRFIKILALIPYKQFTKC